MLSSFVTPNYAFPLKLKRNFLSHTLYLFLWDIFAPLFLVKAE